MTVDVYAFTCSEPTEPPLPCCAAIVSGAGVEYRYGCAEGYVLHKLASRGLPTDAESLWSAALSMFIDTYEFSRLDVLVDGMADELALALA